MNSSRKIYLGFFFRGSGGGGDSFYTHPVRVFELAMEIKRVMLLEVLFGAPVCLSHLVFDLEQVIRILYFLLLNLS